jgi:hypothetical protein
MNTREPTGLALRRQRENVKSQHHGSTFTSSCPREAGKGDHPAQAGWWKGRLTQTSLGRTPPPPFGWSPSPALRAGATKRNRSRDALTRPSFAHHDNAKNRFASGNQRGKRSAERRMPSMSALRKRVYAVCATHLLRGCAPIISSLPRLQERVREGARPPFGAHACGTRHRLSPRWLSPRTGFPADEPRRCFARLALLSAVKHAPCRPVFLPADRGPRAARERIGISARGHRPSLPSFRLALPERRPH